MTEWDNMSRQPTWEEILMDGGRMDSEEEAYYPYDRSPQNEGEDEGWPWRQGEENQDENNLGANGPENRKPSWRQCSREGGFDPVLYKHGHYP